MSRHAQPHPSGGWLSLSLAVVAALGGASIAGNVAAGPGRVAIGWASVLASAVFLLQYRSERQSSLRLARLDHARRRDAARLREELAEAHHRSRLAVERSYAAVARAESLAAEVTQLMAVIRSTPAPVTSVQVLPMMPPAPLQTAPPAPVAPVAPTRAGAPAAPLAPAANGSGPQPGTSLDLPLVTAWPEPVAPPVSITSKKAAPPASQTAPSDDWSPRVDLRAVEPRVSRGA
jgi:hypothetical protein